MNATNTRTVLVTGAASGIGYETARSFAKRGYQLVISDINEAALNEVQQEFSAAGARCFAKTCDVASIDSVAELCAAAIAESGDIDILVNNAGVAYLGGFEETPLSDWRRIFDVNVMGIVHCINAFLPRMRAAGGRKKIVNVASLAGFSPAPNMSAYAASKHAVVGLSEVLALELYGSEISVLVVCPGIIETNITQGTGMTAPSITGAQLAKLQRYYHEHGAQPSVVAEGIIRSVERNDAFLFVGPMAKSGHTMGRISRRLARRMTISGARKSGYLN
jgi:short-subunit dehydrogenase